MKAGQNRLSLPTDPVDCCNSVGESVVLTIESVCTCEITDTVDVESIPPL